MGNKDHISTSHPGKLTEYAEGFQAGWSAARKRFLGDPPRLVSWEELDRWLTKDFRENAGGNEHE